jgi:hypothetical protein
MYISELPTYILYYLRINLCSTGEKGTMRAAETRSSKMGQDPACRYNSFKSFQQRDVLSPSL